jgi:hypothetical protein
MAERTVVGPGSEEQQLEEIFEREQLKRAAGTSS